MQVCRKMAAYGAESVLRGACDQALAYHISRTWFPFLPPLVGKQCRTAGLHVQTALAEMKCLRCVQALQYCNNGDSNDNNANNINMGSGKSQDDNDHRPLP